MTRAGASTRSSCAVLSGVPVFDFGDAPDPTYPTLSASDGAGHVVGGSLYLGAIDRCRCGRTADAGATGDDADANGDDEDGVTFTSPLIPGTSRPQSTWSHPQSGLLERWIDFNGDGDWSDAGEQVFQDQSAGRRHEWSVVAQFQPMPAPWSRMLRFRVSTQSGLMPSGLAGDGEVEDYAAVHR